MDGLLHEAIHSLLYMRWIKASYVTDPATLEAVRIVSPWTGHSLALHSFFHACHVWYGLWRFWSLALQNGTYPESVASEMADRAHRGFVHRSMPESMARMSEFVIADAQSVNDLVATAQSSTYA